MNQVYIFNAECELNYGYGDFFLAPDLVRYPEVGHCYLIEMKYVKPNATEAEVAAKSKEADGQLIKYSQDASLQRLRGHTRLHLLKVVFRGPDMAVCEEL